MIFVDTSFWVALRNRRARHHNEAKALFGLHGQSGLVSTNHVRGETWTFLRRRVGHQAAVGFLDAVENTKYLETIFVSEDTERLAAAWLRQHDEREYSFVDATSFRAMRELRINQALAFDGDFAAAGFIELRPA